MAKVRLKGKKFVNGAVARVDDVQDAVEDAGKRIQRAAEANLRSHRSNEDAVHHSISGGKNFDAKYGALDYEVTLSGPAPMSLEFGHMLVYYGQPTGKFIQGLHILYRAAGLI